MVEIQPFEATQLNPNSYNYRLGRYVLEAKPGESEAGYETARDLASRPFLLMPGKTYLGHTFERLGSRHYVTILNGRSSIGRLGLFVNFAADLGHVGTVHCWTLEIMVVQPVWVQYGMQIGQVSFWIPSGEVVQYSAGYSVFDSPAPARPEGLMSR
jgi:dCTP deaminase